MEPRGDIDNPQDLDPTALGFMCGLEIHQQLATGKLHSRMPSELFDYGIAEVPDDWPRSSRRPGLLGVRQARSTSLLASSIEGTDLSSMSSLPMPD